MGKNTLQKVVYELFDYEKDILKDSNSENSHTIDRELYLEFHDQKRIFISWNNAPLLYAVGLQENSFFNDEDKIIIDASTHPIWKKITGQEIDTIILDEGNQVLEIRSPIASVYLSTYENGNWLADVITISDKKPELPM
jgi:hypothetical protein